MTLNTLKKLRPSIKKLLNHPNELLVVEALKIFAAYERKKDSKLIKNYLSDPRQSVQAAAIYAFCRISKRKPFYGSYN